MTLEPGQLFAKDFEIERRLSQGGMGTVYVARQLSTDKRRALKLMHPQLAPDARSRQRFIDEARIGGRIDSEHVVEVVAAGIDESSGSPWLAMELLDGEDLGSLTHRRGALPAGEVRDVFLQAGHALGLAHDKGIVHRDLKPENLFLSRARREGGAAVVKVLDFGIALALPSGGAGVVTSAVGSPFWMAPEQAKPGATLTPSTDVWALGLIAFQLLSGGSYWRTAKENDASIGAVLTEILVSPLEPASARATSLGLAALPAGFDAWFSRCVSREPAERFSEAHSCLSALDAVLAAVAPRAAVVSSQSAKATSPSLGLEATLQRTPPVVAPDARATPNVHVPAAATSRVWWVLAAAVLLAAGVGVRQLVTKAPPPPPLPVTPVAVATPPPAVVALVAVDAGTPAEPEVDAGEIATAPALLDAGVKQPEKKVQRPHVPVEADRVDGPKCANRFVTPAEARADTRRLCALLSTWDIARLAGGGSMDGPGYQCKVRDHDTRELGISLCHR